MNNLVRTVSDAKRAFYGTHTRPINSIYRRVVEEMLVEMHLLSVHQHFAYDSIYALGVVTTFDRFMNSYRPESDVVSIFSALCTSMGLEASKVRQDGEKLLASVAGTSWDALAQGDVPGEIGSLLSQLAENKKFKYSRLFAVGLYSLMETVDPAAVKDNDKLQKAVEQFTTMLKLPDDKMQKDLEIYRGNLDKLAAASTAIAETIAADRKKRDQREQEKAAAAAATLAKDEATPAS